VNRFSVTTLFRRLAASLLVLVVFPLSAWPQNSGSGKASEKTAPSALVYSGEPLQVRLECNYDALLQAGLVCNEDVPCELLLELIGMGETKTSAFAIGNIHTQEATISSVLLASHDGGKTWLEPAGRIAAASLESIQFADDEHGWISGQEHDIDSSTTPFFYITQDGGKYWDRRNVWGNNEDRSGVIAEYYFETPQHGFVVIERSSSSDDTYELHESRNGGRSWSPRQISGERPAIRRRLATPEQAEWRLSENRETGVYDIERRQGSAWEKVASVSSEVGTCLGKEAEKEKEEAEKLLTQQEEPAPPADDPEKKDEPVVQDGVLVVPGAR
jgi:hypothetical protein